MLKPEDALDYDFKKQRKARRIEMANDLKEAIDRYIQLAGCDDADDHELLDLAAAKTNRRHIRILGVSVIF